MAKRVRITHPDRGESVCFDDEHSLTHMRALGWSVEGEAAPEPDDDSEPSDGSDQE